MGPWNLEMTPAMILLCILHWEVDIRLYVVHKLIYYTLQCKQELNQLHHLLLHPWQGNK